MAAGGPSQPGPPIAAVGMLARVVLVALAASSAHASSAGAPHGKHAYRHQHHRHGGGAAALSVDAAGDVSDARDAPAMVRREPRHTHPHGRHEVAVEASGSLSEISQAQAQPSAEPVAAVQTLETLRPKPVWRRPASMAGLQGTSPPPNNGSKVLLSCHTATRAPTLGMGCPEECPYFAEDQETPCSFYCVQKSDCGTFPLTEGEDVPDVENKMCRRCEVEGCRVCAQNGMDQCKDCALGYVLDVETGLCKNATGVSGVPIYMAGLLGVLALFVVVWYLDLAFCRRTVNQAVLQKALEHRQQLKICDEERDGRPGLPVWEGFWWKTSVHHDLRAGGAGFLLHMDFQLMLIVWILTACVGWVVFGLISGSAAFTIGTGARTTGVELCNSVHNDFAARERILLGKAIFVAIFYIGSLVYFLSFAYRQRKKFVQLDDDVDTLVDFAVLLKGFPAESERTRQAQGREGSMEQEYEGFLKQLTGDANQGDIVGVSVCWDREIHRDPETAAQLSTLIESIEAEKDLAPGSGNLQPGGGDEPTSGVFARMEAALGLDALLGVDQPGEVLEPVRQPGEASADGQDSNRKALLEKVPCTGVCYVVCKTQGAMVRLLEALKRPEARFRADPNNPTGTGFKLRGKAAVSEPSAVRWDAMANHSLRFPQRIAKGFSIIILAIIFWTVMFYLPYGFYTYVVSAATGQELGMYATGFFTVLVILGNVIMYWLCGMVAETVVKPTLVDEKETFYMISYTLATFLNMVLDVGVLLFTTYFAMVARGVRDEEGVLLKQLPSTEAKLESFPMMMFGGFFLCAYNLGGCFILPFLAEPVMTIFLPYHLGGLFVRSRKVPFKSAVAILAPSPTDLGRYADHVMNATLCVMSLFFASGWVLFSLAGLLACYVYIYAYDRIRALRYVEWFHISTDLVDQNAHRLLSLPCATLAACLVFNLRLMRAFGLGDGYTIPMIFMAALFHVIVHLILLQMIFAATHQDKPSKESPTYHEIAKDHPIDWFTGNKVHCLRNNYFFKGREKMEWVAPYQVHARAIPKPSDEAGEASTAGVAGEKDNVPLVAAASAPPPVAAAAQEVRETPGAPQPAAAEESAAGGGGGGGGDIEF